MSKNKLSRILTSLAKRMPWWWISSDQRPAKRVSNSSLSPTLQPSHFVHILKSWKAAGEEAKTLHSVRSINLCLQTERSTKHLLLPQFIPVTLIATAMASHLRPNLPRVFSKTKVPITLPDYQERRNTKTVSKHTPKHSDHFQCSATDI